MWCLILLYSDDLLKRHSRFVWWYLFLIAREDNYCYKFVDAYAHRCVQSVIVSSLPPSSFSPLSNICMYNIILSVYCPLLCQSFFTHFCYLPLINILLLLNWLYEDNHLIIDGDTIIKRKLFFAIFSLMKKVGKTLFRRT